MVDGGEMSVQVKDLRRRLELMIVEADQICNAEKGLAVRESGGNSRCGEKEISIAAGEENGFEQFCWETL